MKINLDYNLSKIAKIEIFDYFSIEFDITVLKAFSKRLLSLKLSINYLFKINSKISLPALSNPKNIDA